MNHEDFMRRAIALARNVPQAPFGAIIVRPGMGEVLANGYNQMTKNPVLHGEIDAINNCAKKYPNIDWTTLALYTTAEPCPMCQSAILWAGIANVYYGTSIPYLKTRGWNQIDIRADQVVQKAPFRHCKVTGGILETECNRLFDDAAERPGK